MVEALEEHRGEPRLDVDEEFVGKRVDEGVGLHPTLVGDEGRVATAQGSQGGDVVGDLAVEESDAIGTGEAESAAAAEVEDAGGGAEGGVFGGGIAVVGDGFTPVHLGEPGPQGGVDLVQWQRHERGLWLSGCPSGRGRNRRSAG